MDLVEVANNPNRHPWEISRMKNVSKICCDIIENFGAIKICDVGAGDRYFDHQLLVQLEKKGIRPSVFAVDNQYSDLNLGSDQIHLRNDIMTIQKKSMELIVMMDVLEHIEDDETFIQKVIDCLKDNGTLLITVPAYESLFSSHDKFLNHYRRYEYKELKKLLADNEMEIIRCHYFYSSLFIVRWLQVKLKKAMPNDIDAGIGMWKYSAENIRTRVIEKALNFDFKVNSLFNLFGIRFPGLSLICVAKKKTN